MTDRNWYTRHPLYIRIIIGLLIGLGIGSALYFGRASATYIALPGMISGLILKLLGALAPPLILIAVLDTLIKARLAGCECELHAGWELSRRLNWEIEIAL